MCPQCQGELRKLGEDISEVLEYVPASFGRGPGAQELLVRGIGCGRRARSNHLQLDWFGETQWLDPEAYLRETLTRIADHPITRIEELLPWNLVASVPPEPTA